MQQLPTNYSELAKTHICLVSDDPMPMLTPIIDKSIPSQKVVFAYTDNQKNLIQPLLNVCRSRGYVADTWVLPSSQNTADIKLSFFSLFDQETNLENEVWLNATSHSLHVSLAAFEVARSYNVPVFVVEPDSDSLCWLSPEHWPASPIQDKLSLKEYFSLKDMSCEASNALQYTSQLKKLADLWLHQSGRLIGSLSKLNFLASSATNSKLQSPAMDAVMLDDQGLQCMIDELLLAQAICVKNMQLRFNDKATRFFCAGGWLELAVLTLCQRIKLQQTTIQDLALGLEVKHTHQQRDIHNELDVVALVNNKLHIIECKTVRFQKGQVNAVLYKLEALKKSLGTPRTRAALVSFYAPSKLEKVRAEKADIALIALESGDNVAYCLEKWLLSA